MQPLPCLAQHQLCWLHRCRPAPLSPSPCSYVQDFDEKNPATYKGLNLYSMPMSALYAHFGLDAQTIDFIGHALALHR